jgi:hypothetical protein
MDHLEDDANAPFWADNRQKYRHMQEENKAQLQKQIMLREQIRQQEKFAKNIEFNNTVSGSQFQAAKDVGGLQWPRQLTEGHNDDLERMKRQFQKFVRKELSMER